MVALQAAVFIAITYFASSLKVVYIIIAIIMFFIIIYIVNDDSDPNMKICWVMLLLLVPTFGTLMYLYFRFQPASISLKKKLKKINMKKIFAIMLAALLLCAAACTKAPAAEEPKPEAPVDETAQGDIELPEIGADEPVVGGWTIVGVGKAQLPEEAEQAFKAVTEKLLGADYVPVAYLGSQVVAGMNYAILCTRTLVTANPVTDLAVLTVYVDLTGSAELLNISDFNIGD